MLWIRYLEGARIAPHNFWLITERKIYFPNGELWQVTTLTKWSNCIANIRTTWHYLPLDMMQYEVHDIIYEETDKFRMCETFLMEKWMSFLKKQEDGSRLREIKKINEYVKLIGSWIRKKKRTVKDILYSIFSTFLYAWKVSNKLTGYSLIVLAAL